MLHLFEQRVRRTSSITANIVLGIILMKIILFWVCMQLQPLHDKNEKYNEIIFGFWHLLASRIIKKKL